MTTDAYEQKVLFWLREMLLKHDPQIGSGDRRITIDDVYIEPGGTEDNMAVIMFREVRRPLCRFGFRFPLYKEERKHWYDPEKEGPQAEADMIVHGYLREQIEAADEGLPENCADNSITWV